MTETKVKDKGVSVVEAIENLLVKGEKERVFETTLPDGKVIKLKVVRPNQEQVLEVDRIYRIKFSKILRDGMMTNVEMEKYIERRKLWEKIDDEKVMAIQKEMIELQEKLEKSEFKEDAEGLTAALMLQQKREELLSLTRKIGSLYDNTAENTAEELRMQHICVMNVLKEDGSPFFKDFKDFSDRANDLSTGDALKETILFNHSLRSNFSTDFPENRWMIKNGYMDEDGNYVTKEDKPKDNKEMPSENTEDSVKPEEQKNDKQESEKTTQEKNS